MNLFDYIDKEGWCVRCHGKILHVDPTAPTAFAGMWFFSGLRQQGEEDCREHIPWNENETLAELNGVLAEW